jgi:ribonucleoside-diphosphate reductase beta chain
MDKNTAKSCAPFVEVINMNVTLASRPGLLTSSNFYRPTRYPWAELAMRRQHEVHWLPWEVPLGQDIADWATKLSPVEKSLLTQIFRFFTQSDIEVSECYHEKYSRVFEPIEVKMMLSAFNAMEGIHIQAYALLLDTLGLPESDFSAFASIPAMQNKVDYMHQFGVGTNADILRTTAMFGAFTEGVSLYSMFAMMLNFPRHNKMKGMGQIVSWSVRDESLHAESIIRLHHAFAAEVGGRSASVERDIIQCARQVVALEDAFVDEAFKMGAVPGLQPSEIKAYVRFIANWRLKQLHLDPIYSIHTNPLEWLQVMLSGVEHQNFFEGRATEYSKASSKGEWHGKSGVWENFSNHTPSHPKDRAPKRPEGYYSED